ncbi:50S ribosomal protein L10 [Haloactinomyces albus]|uniref:Large ribosomal subunit protein uL10 n=1 Tax=Haloactinomyces albus TaxID=1352928 RepID=A0AAE4CM22_9ACTN|nr:50S ribosomal protein L10 [Haloactinomyces albus]MDR7302439.1 large subunit ribosomal protein L10 [Haloactinomyces albus]
MAKPEKVDAVNELTEHFNKATATVVTEYRGLSMGQLKELRRSLGEGATYRVAKNTLVKIATKESGVEGLDDLFVGPTALTFIEGEPVEAAKVLRDFSRDNKALVIKGGYMDGRPISVSEVERIADLDSREATLGKLAGAMKAKLTETAGLLSAPASQVARMTEALKDKKDTGSAES